MFYEAKKILGQSSCLIHDGGSSIGKYEASYITFNMDGIGTRCQRQLPLGLAYDVQK